MNQSERNADWTVDDNGIANSSEKFLECVDRVQEVIFNSGHDLIHGRAPSVARVIVANLAHKHGLAPVILDEPKSLSRSLAEWALQAKTNGFSPDAVFTTLFGFVVSHAVMMGWSYERFDNIAKKQFFATIRASRNNDDDAF